MGDADESSALRGQELPEPEVKQEWVQDNLLEIMGVVSVSPVGAGSTTH